MRMCHGILFITIFFLLLPRSHSITGVRKNASVHLFNLIVRKKEHLFSRTTLPFKKNLHPLSCSTLPFEKIYIRSAVRLNRLKKNTSVQLFHLTIRKKFASVQLFNRSVSNGLSSCFLSVRLLCVQPFKRIS